MAERCVESRLSLDDGSLVDLLDRLLDTGVAADGSVLITLAGVDLIRLDLRLLLASVETLYEPRLAPDRPHHRQQGLRADDGRPYRSPSPYPSYAPHGSAYRPTLDHPPTHGSTATSDSRRGNTASTGYPSAARSLSTAVADRADLTELAGRPDHDPDPAAGVAGLVVAVVDILRQLLQRQALHRMDAGTLTNAEIERLGRALQALDRQVHELAGLLGLRGPPERDDSS